MTIYTIGVYGWTMSSFSKALVDASVTSLIDIRRRRGLRGSVYSFANASALERLVKSLSIDYLPAIALAPTEDMRALQRDDDSAKGLLKRNRVLLSNAFCDAYMSMLSTLDPSFRERIAEIGGERPALLCVEREATACHRTLAAAWIAQGTNVEIVDLIPIIDNRS